jgi:hypothetical protein
MTARKLWIVVFRLREVHTWIVAVRRIGDALEC